MLQAAVVFLLLLVGHVASPDGGHASRAEFKEVRAFPDHFIPHGEPWSPTHERLVLSGGDGFSVYDAAHPESGLRPVFSGAWVRQVTWSPDGDWLLFLAGDANPNDTRSLIVVSWRGGPRDTLVRDVTFYPATWASDGTVAYITGTDVHWVKPPHGSSPRSGDLRRAPSLVASVGASGLRVQWIRPGTPKGEPLVTPVRGAHILIMDSAPSLGRYLIQGIAAENPSTLLLDAQGATVSDLGAAGIPFAPSGISADRSLIIGYREIDDGDRVQSSRMYVAASDGSWSTPVDNVPAAFKACFARSGRTIAYEDPINGGVHVGQVNLLP